MKDRSLIFVEQVRRVAAIAQTGLAYTENQFDVERYEELHRLANELLAFGERGGAVSLDRIFPVEGGYATPKVGCRGAIIEGDRVLLVREAQDGRWALPGGWIDVNESPATAVEKEIYQEAGVRAEAIKLCLVADHAKRGPAYLYHVYTLLFLCEYRSGDYQIGHETLDVRFFSREELPELSEGRSNKAMIECAFRHAYAKDSPTEFD
jgi:ADP-ribose pyrophosphatase YjhB (NUDIX family)